MAKNSITDYSKTAASNTDIQSVDIAEGCLPSGINNAIREIMADLADMNDGTVSLTSPSFAAASLTGNLSFGDNDKAIFGAGSDLEIYHDGSNSYVKDAGTGNLNIQGNHLSLEDSTGTRFFLGLQGGETRIYNQGNEKLAATSTGVDVTGTVTADGLTVDGDVLIDDGVGRITLDSVSGANRLLSTTTGFGAYEDFEFRADNYIFKTSTTERLRIDSSGNVGIGTSSPSTNLHVYGSSPELRVQSTATNNGFIRFINTSGSMSVGMSGSAANQFLLYDRTNSHTAYLYAGGASGSHTWRTNNSERLRIDSSGNVGIGTSSPDKALTISASDSQVRLYDADGTNQFASFQSDNGTTKITSRNNTSHGTIAFQRYNGTTVAESMRIDSSGNVLVGKSTTAFGTAGIRAIYNGQLQATASSNEPLGLNRLSSDGAIADFYKDSTKVGTIFSSGGQYIGFGNSAVGLLFLDAADDIRPWNTNTNAARDNAIDLGNSDARFKDLYLGGGVYLGGTGSANKLDDYEEGTWTPTVSDGTISYSDNFYIPHERHLYKMVFISALEIQALATGRSSNMVVSDSRICHLYGIK